MIVGLLLACRLPDAHQPYTFEVRTESCWNIMFQLASPSENRSHHKRATHLGDLGGVASVFTLLLSNRASK
jgi:hypothetical protein